MRGAARAPLLALIAVACASPPATSSTRSGAAVVENVQVLASGLEAPWAIDLSPDGRLFVTERPGRVRVIALGPGGGLRAEPWATLPASDGSGGEKGLLGLALDTDFGRSGFVYLYYSYQLASGQTRNKLVRMRDASGRGVEETVLLDGIPGSGNHDGGRVRLGPDGKL